MSRRLVSICLLALLLLASPITRNPSARAGEPHQPAGPPEGAIHVVERGETLFLIAEQYGTTVNALAHANGLTDPTTIYVGQRLQIPALNAEFATGTSTSYVVQAGDSLDWIARRYATTWHHLARVNQLLSPDALHTGQVIRVPVVDPHEWPGGGLHIVGERETLYQIAVKYSVLPWTLTRANSSTHPRLVYPGLALIVPGGGAHRLPAPFESVDVQPLPVKQGQSVVIGVRTREPVTITGSAFGTPIRFSEADAAYYAVVGVHVFTDPGLYQATLRSVDAAEQITEISVDIVVEGGDYGYERIAASPSLLDPELVSAERERLDALRPTFTEQRTWKDRFIPPCPGTISSYFGTHRAYNDGPYTSYHGGVDLRGSTGTPVHAPADGIVLLADTFAVRGNALVVDHGWGVLTGYWHLSQFEVGLGEEVKQGDVIARVGNTGLSTGSHLHWEMWVGGVNVDPLQWLDAFYSWPHEQDASDGGDVQ